jgi:ribose transport system permease protein
VSTDAPAIRSGRLSHVEMPALAYRLLAVALICLGLAVVTDAFLTVDNLLNVLRQTALLFLIASGLTLVVLAGGLDLSIAATVGLSACIVASVVQNTGSVGLGVAAGCATGTLVGLLNGVIVAGLKLKPIIATYGMLWVVNGATYWYMGGETIYGFPERFRAIGSGYWLGVPVPVYLMGAVAALGVFFTRSTTWGREIYALGANPLAAHLSGIPVAARLVLVYTLSGAMGGVSGVVYLARLNSAEAGIGDALLLPAIAAVLVGGTSLFGGAGGMSGTLIGALILTLVLNGMNLLVINSNWQPFVTGCIILLSAGIDTVTRRLQESRG